MSNQIGRLAQILRTKPRVITKAVFWSIPHNSGKEDIRLKLGRYKKTDELEIDNPKSELTLDNEEFQALIHFLQIHYEPFRTGTKAFIPLDKPFVRENAEQIKALFDLPEKKELLEFIVKNKIIPTDLVVGLQTVERHRAIKNFERMLQSDLKEHNWQKWFEENDWVLGSEFVRVLDERQIDTRNISDFLMEAYDGFLDIIEIKRPEGELQFWASKTDHGNYIPSNDLIKAITQASKYIYEVEREANSVKFLEKVDNVKTIKPRCSLIFGRSFDWNTDQKEAYRIINSSFHNINILTYDHVLARAKRIVGLKKDS